MSTGTTHLQNMRPQVAAAVAELAGELHRAPCASEIASRLAVDVEDVIEVLACDGAAHTPGGSHDSARQRSVTRLPAS